MSETNDDSRSLKKLDLEKYFDIEKEFPEEAEDKKEANEHLKKAGKWVLIALAVLLTGGLALGLPFAPMMALGACTVTPSLYNLGRGIAGRVSSKNAIINKLAQRGITTREQAIRYRDSGNVPNNTAQTTSQLGTQFTPAPAPAQTFENSQIAQLQAQIAEMRAAMTQMTEALGQTMQQRGSALAPQNAPSVQSSAAEPELASQAIQPDLQGVVPKPEVEVQDEPDGPRGDVEPVRQAATFNATTSQIAVAPASKPTAPNPLAAVPTAQAILTPMTPKQPSGPKTQASGPAAGGKR